MKLSSCTKGILRFLRTPEAGEPPPGPGLMPPSSAGLKPSSEVQGVLSPPRRALQPPRRQRPPLAANTSSRDLKLSNDDAPYLHACISPIKACFKTAELWDSWVSGFCGNRGAHFISQHCSGYAEQLQTLSVKHAECSYDASDCARGRSKRYTPCHIPDTPRRKGEKKKTLPS